MRQRAVRALGLSALLLLAVGLGACRPEPVRQPVTLDAAAPVGRVEGQRFTGIRYPFDLSAEGTAWRVDTHYPKFLLEQGYEEEGLLQSQVFAFNPATRSSLQVSLSPAGPYDTFSQKGMEFLVSLATGSMEQELEGEYGKDQFAATHGETQPAQLAGVPYAARNDTRYQAEGKSRENGWIYGFAEPFQIFVLYQLEDPDNAADRAAVDRIISSFRYRGF